MDAPEYLDDESAARQHFAALGTPAALAMDTEFLRESTYRPRLCLIQIECGGRIACLDTLAAGVPATLAALLGDPGVLKILHAARQDLEVLFQAIGQVPGPVYDTQIAAALLGHGDQIGYAGLAEELLGVSVDKGHARTDWSRRPLSPAQLDYAAEDVAHLQALRSVLDARLAEAGRSAWLEEECAKLADPALYQVAPTDAWQRVKGHGRLEPEALGRLTRLAAWREEEAIARNRPRRWILKDDVLLALAARGPADRAALAAVPDMPPAVVRRHGERLETLLSEPLADSDVPELPAWNPLEPAEERLLKRLGGLLRETAKRESIAAPLIATRRELEKLIRGRRDLPLLSGWRRDVAGADLLKAVEARG